jgi:putative spermidine/putrescine transport system substrate-binding protein
MHRSTTVIAFLAITAIITGCSGGGGTSPAASVPAASPPAASACNPPRQEGVTLSFVSFGGVYQEAQRKAWLEPYTELTGVQFTEDENSLNATIKAQVESGQVTWDVVDVGNDFGTDAHKDLLEPLDYSLIPRDEMNEALGVTDYRVPDIT